VSALGKAIACCVAILGLLMISLPIAVMTKHFDSYFVYTAKRSSILKNLHRKKLFQLKKRLTTIGWLQKRKILEKESEIHHTNRQFNKYSISKHQHKMSV
jgi:hypothetical protein